MKKIFALLLALTMLFGVTGAMATATAEEEVQIQNATVDFDVTLTLPEGYMTIEDRDNGTLTLGILPESEDGVYMILSIAHSEEYEGRSIGDLTEDEVNSILDQLDDDFNKTELHQMTTEYGTDVYLLNEVGTEEASFASGFTLYQGYFINIYLGRYSDETLTQEDLDLGLKFISDLWFVEAK